MPDDDKQVPQPVEGPKDLTQTDNRPNDWDPDVELPQDATWRPEDDA